jgi:hypothetical protein
MQIMQIPFLLTPTLRMEAENSSETLVTITTLLHHKLLQIDRIVLGCHNHENENLNLADMKVSDLALTL